MAISTKYKARITVTTDEHSKLVSGHYKLPPGVVIESATPSPDGASVTLVMHGQGLGTWAVPVPPPCKIEQDPATGAITIQPA
ncbi:MAG: hypothetical protein ACLP9L_34715 [Thermoguttaceae bacterium]